jgi:two-component system response regulator
METAGEILLVEDSQADAELTLRALRNAKISYRIRVVHDGEEALDFLFCRGTYAGASLEQPPRLVLLDLKLPKVDGLGVLRQIKGDSRTRTIPVVILTSSREDRDVTSSYQLGVNSYVQKPVDFDQFRGAVQQLGLYWMHINQVPPAAHPSSLENS